MGKHEEKNCPCCKTVFECKPGSITQCQCSAIRLSARERDYVESKFEDCLCLNCLVILQKEYALITEAQVYRKG